LPAGRHVIVVGANYGSKDRPYGNMVQNFEYDLDVGGVTILSGAPDGKSREKGWLIRPALPRS
jgi:hypothetical protein